MNKNFKSILYIILSGLCFMIVNLLVKILGNHSKSIFLHSNNSFPIHELVLARSIVSFLISAFLLKRKNLNILGTNRKGLLVRGTAGMIALTLFFFTIQHLPIAIASSIQYTAPIFTVLFASIYFKEKVSSLQWTCIFIALIGVYIIGFTTNSSDLDTSMDTFKWIGLGLLSALFSGIAYVSVIKLRSTEHPLNIVIYFPMLSIPIMLIWCMFDFVLPEGIDWIYLLLLGIFTQIAQLLLTKALMYGNVEVVSPFQYLGSIYAILLGYYIFDEKLSYIAIAGIALIIVGVISNVLLQKKANKKIP